MSARTVLPNASLVRVIIPRVGSHYCVRRDLRRLTSPKIHSPSSSRSLGTRPHRHDHREGIQEILGLTWGDIDFRERVIRVRAQLSRGTTVRPARRVDLKTKAGRRDIALAGQLEPYLRDHLRATERSSDLPRSDAYVFATASGTALNRNNVAKRGLDRAAEARVSTATVCPSSGFTISGTHSRVTYPRGGRSGSRVPSARSRTAEHHARHLRARVRARARLDDVRDSIDEAFGASRI